MHQIPILAQAVAAAPIPAADIWDWGTAQSIAASGAFKGIGSALGVLFVIIAAWRARGALAGMIAGALSAVIFLFFLNNIGSSDVQEKVKDTVKGAGRLVEHPRSTADPAAEQTPVPGHGQLT